MYLHIDSITCINQDDYSGNDEIYMIIKNGMPHTVNAGEFQKGQTHRLTVDVALADGSEHTIEVWEGDALSANDLIGTIYLNNHEHNTDQEAVVDNGSGVYKVWFKIVDETH